MQLTKKQLEFWTAILVVILVVSAFIMLVDFGIKGAILEESVRIRLKIEEFNRGQKDSGTVSNGTDIDATFDPPLPSSLLVDKPTGMETTESSNGDTPKASTAKRRRSQSSRPDSN